MLQENASYLLLPCLIFCLDWVVRRPYDDATSVLEVTILILLMFLCHQDMQISIGLFLSEFVTNLSGANA